jgi:hypothetical protein
MKKILMIGGAAVAGFVVYKMVKGRTSKTAAIAAPQTVKIPSHLAAKLAGRVATFTKVAGVEEDLGLDEELGSLGSSW